MSAPLTPPTSGKRPTGDELRRWIAERPQFTLFRGAGHGVRIMNSKGFAVTQGHATDFGAIAELYHSELGRQSQPPKKKVSPRRRLSGIATGLMGLLHF